MAQDIKQRIVLEGEKEYNSALRSAQRNLKTLRSELKAETAELGSNATAQQKNEVKAKSLKKQIAEQEKIVKTYRAALAEVKEKYGDNEEAIAKWETKLNDARTALANMKNGLESVNSAFKTVESGAQQSTLETKALADSFGTISDKAGAMSTAIENVFLAVVNTIGSAVSEVWGQLMEIAGKSDNYLDLASFLGADATQVQQWDRAMKAAGGDLSDITNMVSRLKYGGKGDKFAEWFKIDPESYTNDLDFAQAAFQAMVDLKDEMVANGTWSDAMEELFGSRKTQEVDGVLSDWDAILEGLKTFDVENGGYGLTDDELQTMADLNLQVLKLQEAWNGFKESVATKIFGKLALDLTSNAQGALDALLVFMNTDDQAERDKAIQDFEANITEAFKRIGEAIEAAGEAMDEAGKELQKSENGYVKLLGDLLVALSDVLEWMAKPEALDQIKAFVEGFFGLWIGGKAMKAVGTIASMASNIALIKGFGAASAASAAGAGAAGAGAGAAGAAGAKAAGTGLVGTALRYISGAGAFLGVLFENAFKHQGNDDIFTEEELAEYEASHPEVEAQRAQFQANKAAEEEANTEYEDLDEPLLNLLDTQLEAAEKYWDLMRSGEATPDQLNMAYQDLLDHFIGADGGMEQLGQLMSLLDTLSTEIPDLPSWWFSDGTGGTGLNSDDINTFNSIPGRVGKAVQTGMSGIQVKMDGETVGRLVAPYVSQQIAMYAQ